MNKACVTGVHRRNADGDLLPPSAGLAPTEWQVPPAASAHHRLTPPPARLPPLDRILLVIACAAMLAEVVMGVAVAAGWLQ